MKKAGVYKKLSRKLPDTMHELYKKKENKKNFINNSLSFLENNKIIPILFTISIAVFIFYLSNQSAPLGGIEAPFSITKLYHFADFFSLNFFFLASLKSGKMRAVFLILAFLFGFFYAVSDELHQFFIPGRHSSFSDVMIDTSGILFSILLYVLISGELKR